MNINEFLELDESVRNELIQSHRTQKRIRDALKDINEERQRLYTHELNLQMECTHPSVISKHLCDEDDYGRRIPNTAYTDNRCPDCGKSWTEDV